jgi:creatinine amidohydrolase/Fe(II)-dependent formamide hydrolase-like protein
MMLHWEPNLVRVNKIPQHDQAHFEKFDSYPQAGAGVPASGVLAPAGGASAAKGKLIIESTVAAMSQSLARHFH